MASQNEQKELKANICNGPSKWELIILSLCERQRVVFLANREEINKLVRVHTRFFPMYNPKFDAIIDVAKRIDPPELEEWYIEGRIFLLTLDEHNFLYPYFKGRYSTKTRRGNFTFFRFS